ncbi:Tn3 family transposase [Streptomyces sp. NPDC048518]|uniref:Tn3 family transposase n=1 Tax=Streptomyces sp. NPDC048518 TaxID=3155029 RepID=UPI00340E9E03
MAHRPHRREGRHALARKVLHGRVGQLNRTTTPARRTSSARSAWSSTPWCSSTPVPYMDAAAQLRAEGFEVREWDVARLSPFVRRHITMLGRYSFQLPGLPGGLRPCAI